MFKKIKFQNFKSWRDTGDITLSPITGFFGSNSSGKSSIIQFFLLLKQTMESSDRQRVLNTGDERSYVELGTLYDITHKHIIPSTIYYEIEWDLPEELTIFSPESSQHDILFSLTSLDFASEIKLGKNQIYVENFCYNFYHGSEQISFKFNRVGEKENLEYELESEGYETRRIRERPWKLPAPIKNYGFPDQVSSYFQNTGFLSDFSLAYEKAFERVYYLGPLREYPKRIYSWVGEKPQDVGRRGELAIPALLACQQSTMKEQIAYWLKELALINSFEVQAIAENRKEYEVRVQRFRDTSQVLITDVGFGVSQVLPVLVLCYYAPLGSTIILEQPEIHLHPSVQAGLADVLIHVMKTRKIQIIIESHSEHLLRRLAEEKDGLRSKDIKLYFCNSNPDGSSSLTNLKIDDLGNIANWPENFFGDEIGDLFAMTEAAIKRQIANE